MNTVENKVTIVIPARKIDFLAKECIQNIRKLYSSVKIIFIVDENISDEDNDFLDENIVILNSLHNKTMSAKRNLGVANSNTEYIAFIDSDAYPNNNWLELSVDFLSNNNDYVAVTGNQFLPIDDGFDRQCLRQVRFSKLFTYPQWCKVIDKNAIEQDCTEFMTSNVIIRREEYLNLNGMNEDIYLAEDNEFSKRIVDLGHKIRFIPKVSVFHHETSFIPFMRKIFCVAYYYSKEFVNKSKYKKISEYISIFFPLFAIFVTSILFVIAITTRYDIFYILNLPLIVVILFLYEAYVLSHKIENKKSLAFFYFLFCFISFCFVWLVGTLSGLLGFKSYDVQKSYKHY